MKKVAYIITDNNIVVNYDGQTHQLSRTDACAPQLIKALKEKRNNDIPNLISASKRLETASAGSFVVKNGQVFVDGIAAPAALGLKIEQFMQEGLPYEPLVKFAKRLQANPSFRAVNELYSFLEKNNQPITEEGMIIFYKKVKENFTDVHTGKFDNHPGQVLEMDRNLVDDNKDSHCSNGFHAGSWGYCTGFYSGGHMLEVEVDPADVVSVPNDLNEKVRVCKYKVLSVIDEELSTPLKITNSNVKTDNSSKDDNANHSYCLNCDCRIDEGFTTCENCEILCSECEVCYADFGEELCPSCLEKQYEEEYDDEEEDSYPWDSETE